MAGDNLSNIQNALGTTFAKKLIRAWNRQSEFLSNTTFVPGTLQGDGKQVSWDVEMDAATAASFAEGSDVASGEYSQDPVIPATLGWGQYRAAVQLTNLEMNAAAANMGNPEALERILEERIFGGVTKITSKMNIDAITGTGLDGNSNPTIVGILSALAATGSYANINKSTYGIWAGNVNANGGTARQLTLDILAKAEQAQFVASGQTPSLLICTPGIKTKYEGIFNSVMRTDLGTAAGINRFNASSEDLYWRGRQLVRDKDMSTGTLVGAKMDGVELHVLPWAPVDDGVPVKMRDLISSNGEDAMSRQLGKFLNVYPLGRTGSAVKFVVEIYCQLKVARPNEHFLVQDISET